MITNKIILYLAEFFYNPIEIIQKTDIIYLVDLIKQLWEYNFSNISKVIAPIIVGGRDVATLVDGEAIADENELNKLLSLQLLECNKLEDSYIQLKYKALQ